MAGVSDLLIMTFGLLAGAVGCLAMPCAPERWSCVKAARPEPDTVPLVNDAADAQRDSEPGFADGLTSVVVA
jgi:hypothetical protein